MKKIVCIVLSVMLLGGTAVFAATTSKTISVSEGASVIVNNNQTSMTPFNYNGSLYVPLRAVSEDLGMWVSWDAPTNSAYIYNEKFDVAKISLLVSHAEVMSIYAMNAYKGVSGAEASFEAQSAFIEKWYAGLIKPSVTADMESTKYVTELIEKSKTNFKDYKSGKLGKASAYTAEVEIYSKLMDAQTDLDAQLIK